MRKVKDFIWITAKKILGRERYEVLRGNYNLQYKPDVKNPRSFNEKIMHMKLYKDMSQATDLSDKYKVRDYIKDKIGEEYLPKLLYVGDTLNDVNWNDLPQKFVIKTNNGGGSEGVKIVLNKDELNIDETTASFNKAIKEKFGYSSNEEWYLDIEPKIIIEEFIEDGKGGAPFDYKLFCFHGKCHYIQVNSGRLSGQKITFYDEQWNKQDFSLSTYKTNKIEKPHNLKEMVALAEKLSAGHDFLRIDLYSLTDSIRFGELTFAPSSGFESFTPEEIDFKMGELI